MLTSTGAGCSCSSADALAPRRRHRVSMYQAAQAPRIAGGSLTAGREKGALATCLRVRRSREASRRRLERAVAPRFAAGSGMTARMDRTPSGRLPTHRQSGRRTRSETRRGGRTHRPVGPRPELSPPTVPPFCAANRLRGVREGYSCLRGEIRDCGMTFGPLPVPLSAIRRLPLRHSILALSPGASPR